MFFTPDTQTADAKIDLEKKINSLLFATSPAFFLIRDRGNQGCLPSRNDW